MPSGGERPASTTFGKTNDLLSDALVFIQAEEIMRSSTDEIGARAGWAHPATRAVPSATKRMMESLRIDSA